MIIFWRLLFGHLLADFTFQTNAVNRWKRKNIFGMLFHCAMHPVFYALLTYPYLSRPWVEWKDFSLNGWACVILLFLAHWIEDEWRVFTIFRYHTPDNTLYFLWDQVIHATAIFAVAPLLQFSNPATQLVPEIWPVLGCLFVVATHMSGIFIYFIEQDLFNKPFPDAFQKYAQITERLGFALCFMLPKNFWAFAAPLWLLGMISLRLKKWKSFSWTSLFVGSSIAGICGLTSRILYYK